MTITIDEIKRLTKLASIKVNDAQLSQLQQELTGIFGWISKLEQACEKLEKIDLSDNLENLHIEREDENVLSDKHDLILANAPKKAHNFFVVPKVVE